MLLCLGSLYDIEMCVCLPLSGDMERVKHAHVVICALMRYNGTKILRWIDDAGETSRSRSPDRECLCEIAISWEFDVIARRVYVSPVGRYGTSKFPGGIA